ncbi:NAD-dependent epimerase [Rhodospirillum rubrum]|uniref:UDP-glucuronate 5'-epimerase n=1 Tax=Rhodospirillum rubrum (strain ATCC 11170 / ATH 1.1.1 / DSM 467 / LMG 4362 / NCIMB 8255 / S1) TaxID=269796 RepID=Q2RNC5_RHORT|nr:NAD-dependent epimerase [Rhodospirillum rubrum]ABC24370.1 UDP-glucuronate 5'-epimerase [Rhodospirillum rubrum ATCC 11170]AEO50121.1 UDP-glucuronate 5'-epimerase [Rhodospirillum rubrum F11]MBK5956092.1 NAD-dependent epimerase [Rhodospirillum rubrum]QXG80295.1 NAD-dependent epimerase [Rhodospirillum rubrum]HAQ01010.1 NAD-dependent epimerase [Rhodospirillum rubrum]
MTTLVTGTAGFIGSHVALRLLQEGEQVVGIDCYTPYYDVGLKEARVARLKAFPGFSEHRLDLADEAGVDAVFRAARPRRVIHLAAQAGVRYSVENPRAYLESNLMGTFSVLEGCRKTGVEHLVFASTSSVYGANKTQPFSEHQPADHPLTFYAATKRATEMMAHSYANIYQLPSTALRFFTVYGPWGRPDMALFLFTEAMLKGEPIRVFNHGKMVRDFTYIDDIVDGILRASAKIPVAMAGGAAQPDPAGSPVGPFRVYNIGNSQPVELMRYIEVLEGCLGVTAKKEMLPMQLGDVPGTWADVSALAADTGYAPKIGVEEGVRRFVDWYRGYYKP